MFEVNSQSVLARRYAFESVLESHHAATTQNLLSDTGLLDGLPLDVQLKFRKGVSSTILATDMKKHAEHISHMDRTFRSCVAIAAHKAGDAAAGDDTVPDELAASRDLAGLLVHSADLSGQALPGELAQQWGELCLEEFSNQVLEEERLGIPVSKFMTGLDDPVKRGSMQLSFCRHVVLPLWSGVARNLPECGPLVANVHSGMALYERQAQPAPPPEPAAAAPASAHNEPTKTE